MEAIPRIYDSNSWITLIIVLVFMLLALINVLNKEQFQEFVRIFRSDKYFQESRKSLKPMGLFTQSLYFVQTLIISLFITMGLFGLDWLNDPPIISFIKIFLLYFVVLTGKFLIEKMLGVLFSAEKMIDDYIFFKITYRNFLAMGLLPILLLITYNWTGDLIFYQVVIGIFAGLNILFLHAYYRKNLKIISSNLYYFILYLCIFEIAPYYILYKVVI